MDKSLITKLDLQDFLALFQTYFAREKEITLEGDHRFYEGFLRELEPILLPKLPNLKNLDNALLHLQKFGILSLEEIVEFCKIFAYFHTLKSLSFLPKEGIFRTWIDKIEIPSTLLKIANYFDENGEIKTGIFEELDGLKIHLNSLKKQIHQQLHHLLKSEKLSAYLVDRQIHYINHNECLLLKAGFHHYIKGVVTARSQGGFFYLYPESIVNLKERENHLSHQIQNVLYQICKEITQVFQKHQPFLKFINQAFDKLDHLNARSTFAKDKNLQFLFRSHTQEIVLCDYAHPNLKNPRLLNLTFKKNLLIATGVNAGGKTMLLKSILSSAFLSKYLIPQRINAQKSKMGFFKEIFAIISDPQNSKNDISTFAGRMIEIKEILYKQNALIAIDEIELGTDSDEASSLYKEILEELLSQKAKIIITTHHKRLASLMATNPQVELCAAMFDEKNQTPTFGFLFGSIGKSYAFETALRYGIPQALVQKAKIHYGEDKEKLNALIEKSTLLEIQLHQKQQDLEKQIQLYQQKTNQLQEQITKQNQEFQTLKSNLNQTYQQALSTLKQEAKTLSQIHQNMNKANQILQIHQEAPSNASQDFQVGERICYGKSRGVIQSKSGEMYWIECDGGFRIKVKASAIKKDKSPPPKPITPKVKIAKNSVGVSLDLHGLRAEEALEKADKFISDCLLAGYDEVLIYHGIGGGVLSKVIKDFLKSHPKVVRFEDAPAQMGGFGAKLVWL